MDLSIFMIGTVVSLLLIAGIIAAYKERNKMRERRTDPARKSNKYRTDQ